MQLKLAILLIATAVSGCSSAPPSSVASVVKQPLDGGCVAMRRFFPMTYSGKGDTQETKTQVMDANAAFKAACP